MKTIDLKYYHPVQIKWINLDDFYPLSTREKLCDIFVQKTGDLQVDLERLTESLL